MKNKIWMASLAAAVLLSASAAGVIGGSVRADETELKPQAAVEINDKNFPDPVFREFVSDFDVDCDGKLSDAELSSVTEINDNRIGFKSMKGIEYFTSLQELTIDDPELISLDLSKNASLSYLYCDCAPLTSLVLGEKPAFTYMYIGLSNLKNLDLSKCPALQELYCRSNPLKSLDLSKNSELVALEITGTDISALDLSKNTKLSSVTCLYNLIKKLDLSNHAALLEFNGGESFVPGSTQSSLEELNFSGCTALETLRCKGNKIKKIDLSGCKNLTFFDAENNQLSSVDFKDCKKLRQIIIPYNCFETLDVSGFPELDTLLCRYNALEKLDVTKNSKIAYVDCEHQGSSSAKVGKLTELKVAGCKDLQTLNFSENQVSYVDFTGCEYLNYCYFTHNNFTELDASALLRLVTLDCGYNQLTSLNVTNCKYLQFFYCDHNQLTTLDLSNNSMLDEFYCNNNHLEKLDISNCPKLGGLRCNSNELTSLDISKNKINILWMHYNKIKTIDLSSFGGKANLEKSGMVASPDGSYLISNEDALGYQCFTMDWDVKLTGIGKVEIPERKTTPTPTKAPTETPKPGEPTPTPVGPTKAPVTPKPGEPTATPVPGKEPSIADFVERLYTVALNRASEPEGKAYWVKEIEDGNRTGGDCAHFFLIEAEEFRNRGLNEEDFVETLYLTFFDRASEPNGKAFWVGQLKSGAMTRNQVISGFIDSTEWCNVCATYGVKSGAPNAKAEFASKNAINFATRLYTCCLGRAPEDGGLKYWSLALTNLEQTGCSAAKNFFKSDEFIGFKLKNDEYVRRLYTTFMGRDPEASEVAYWVGEIAKGTQTKDSVMAFFGQSEEFTNICKKYGIDRGTI